MSLPLPYQTKRTSFKLDINQVLNRRISGGKAYEGLFDRSTGKSVGLGTGSTFLSVDLMKQTVLAHYKQACKIAKILDTGNLKETSERIYNWLYNHIQYKADGYEQLLRSPNSSWANREKGIDCKSYSIFVSSILSCLGITHYIRQIKQTGYNSDKFTHVYIVVPHDQETHDLENGYYNIDPTTHTNQESRFSMKHDTKVSFPHFGLNGSKRGRKKGATTTTTKSSTNKSLLMTIGAVVAGVFLLSSNKK